MFVNSDFLHEYDFFALSTAGSASRHGCFFTHDFLDLREKDKTFVSKRPKQICFKEGVVWRNFLNISIVTLVTQVLPSFFICLPILGKVTNILESEN